MFFSPQSFFARYITFVDDIRDEEDDRNVCTCTLTYTFIITNPIHPPLKTFLIPRLTYIYCSDTYSATPHSKKRKSEEFEPEQKRSRLLHPINLQQDELTQDTFQPSLNFNQDDETTDFTLPLITLEPLEDNDGKDPWYLPNSPPLISDYEAEAEADFVPDLLSGFSSDGEFDGESSEELNFEQLELKLFDCISTCSDTTECTTECNNTV